MKKLISMIALAAISFGSVYAHSTVSTVKSSTMQTDTVKKKKMKPMKKDSTKKKDSTLMKQK
ncbi:hypothetical protein [Mucilaginibacter sp.]|uniref:hypothetical protein n=1 Tax=Mucilaginibacter sp. TaxID=1882438 RepID=UPI003D0E4248